jgi:tRNA-guanine family transglycosylase
LNDTVDFTKRMLPKYKSLDGVFGVLHGVKFAEIEKWRDSLLKIHDFKGWGIGIPSVKERNEDKIWYKLKCLGEVGIKRIHLFGFTDLPYLIQIALYLKRYGIEYCSFDSTRFIATRFSDIYYPLYENIASWFGRDEGRKDLRMICDCPVCKELKPNVLLDEGGETNYVNFHYIMSMHNISHIQRFADTVAELSKYEDLLYRVADKYDLKLVKDYDFENDGMSLMDWGK